MHTQVRPWGQKGDQRLPGAGAWVALVARNPPVNAGDVRAVGSIPGSGRSPGGGHGNPSSVLAWRLPWTEEPGGLQPTGRKESDTPERASTRTEMGLGDGTVVVWSLRRVWLLCDPTDCSPSGSSVHAILQARILEWVAFPFSRASPQLRIKPRSPALQTDSLPLSHQGMSLNCLLENGYFYVL